MLKDIDHVITTIRGNCAGVCLHLRGEDDNHICFTVLVEDDDNWFISKRGFSSFWLWDLRVVLENAQNWLERNAEKDSSGFGWIYKGDL